MNGMAEYLDRGRRAARQPRETMQAFLRASTSATNHDADPRGVCAPGHWRDDLHAADVAVLEIELERRWARDADATRVSLGKYHA